MIDPRWYGFIELGLVFGLVLGWAGWQWWGWWRWKREQGRREAAECGQPDEESRPRT